MREPNVMRGPFRTSALIHVFNPHKALFTSNKVHGADSSKGFTLIELMVTIAILSILAAATAPIYSQYVQRGKIAGALSTLGSLSTQMERNYLDFRQYGENGDCAIGVPAADNFTFSCASTGQDYTWTATSTDGEYKYSVNQTLEKETLAFAGKTVNADDCWMISDSGSCF